jgi:hypothetical protein
MTTQQKDSHLERILYSHIPKKILAYDGGGILGNMGALILAGLGNELRMISLLKTLMCAQQF